MEIWDKLKTPPDTALKSITGGRLRGFSDINPQWRYEALTELFGPCGKGWKYHIKSWSRFEDPEGQQLIVVDIDFYYTYIDKGQKLWSDTIPAYGSALLIAKETDKMHFNDEAHKMAVTDALGTAMKMIGVAADVYMGYISGSKYQTNGHGQPDPHPPQTSSFEATDKQKNYIKSLANSHHISQEQKDWVADNIDSISKAKAKETIDKLNQIIEEGKKNEETNKKPFNDDGDPTDDIPF